MKLEEGENHSRFLIMCRLQASKSSFGNTEQEAREINIKDKLMHVVVDLKRKLLEKKLPLNKVLE